MVVEQYSDGSNGNDQSREKKSVRRVRRALCTRGIAALYAVRFLLFIYLFCEITDILRDLDGRVFVVQE